MVVARNRGTLVDYLFGGQAYSDTLATKGTGSVSALLMVSTKLLANTLHALKPGSSDK